MRADIRACRHEIRPKPGVSTGGEQIEVEHRHDRKDRLDKRFSAWTERSSSSMYPVQQLASGDRRDRRFLVGAETVS